MNGTMDRLSLAAALLLAACAARGEVFRCPLPDGTPLFTDVPCADGEAVQLEPLSTMDGIKMRRSTEALRTYRGSDYDKLMARRDARRRERDLAAARADAEATRERRHREMVEALRPPTYIGHWRHRRLYKDVDRPRIPRPRAPRGRSHKSTKSQPFWSK